MLTFNERFHAGVAKGFRLSARRSNFNTALLWVRHLASTEHDRGDATRAPAS